MKSFHRFTARHHFLSWTSIAAISVAAAAPMGALAQDSDDAIEDVADSIIVTGSRIRRESFDQQLPTTTIDASQIEARNFTNTIEALEDLPLVGVGSNSTGQNTQFGSNAAFVDLFNLGSNRTLSLINGRRIVGANQATIFVPGNAPGAQVDLTVINPALIARTEIVTVGGGPVYGADAVAGVVNIILKEDFEGLSLTAQGGITEFSDGEEYRLSGVWGKNFQGGRGNITLSAEYLDQEGIFGTSGRGFLERDTATATNPFDTGPSDGLPPNLFVDFGTSPITTPGGTIVTNQTASGQANNLIIPDVNADPGINPLLYFANGSVNGTLPENLNPDAATSALFPNIAVPLQFAPNGDLLPYDIGAVAPGLAATYAITSGGAGASNADRNNIRSGLERLTFNLLGRYELTNNIRFKQEFFWVDINTDSINLPSSNTVFGSPTAGSFAIPIFVDQNPLLNAQALGAINALDATNFGDIGGERVLFLDRQLSDIFENRNGTRVRSWRTASELSGDFETLNRDFYWDVSFVYGRHNSENLSEQLLDIEFALATDIVDDGNGNAVCRQQLTGPEAIDLRNPGLSNINTGLSLTPTQAQVDACAPLNLFGVGNASQAAIDYVVSRNAGSSNESEQIYAAASLGGTLVELPGGPFKFNAQGEFREESLAFTAGPIFAVGAARNTQGQDTTGTSQFIEGGFEGLLPIFGDDFAPFLLRSLEFNGAVRVVNRQSTTTNTVFTNPPGTTDVTFTGGGTWRPFDELQFRGNRTRSVRSAAVVELFGPSQTGFGGITHPCAAANVDSGPNPATRRANCISLFTTIEAAGPGATPAQAEAFINSFVPASGVNFGFPAATAGQPILQNEVANNWTVGMVWEPSLIPNLTIAGDYVSIKLAGRSGLITPTTLLTNCVDSANFPDVFIAGALPACEQVLFGVPDGNGGFAVPGTTFTGGAVPPESPAAGNPAVSQGGGEVAFGFFAQGNLGATELNGITGDIRYSFALDELLGETGEGWGDINLRGTVFFLRQFDISGNGTFADRNVQDGELANPKVETRLDLIHNVGPFTHSLQWFRRSSTVVNAQTDVSLISDQNANFAVPSYNTFNYNAAYDINENFTVRFVVNNLLNNDGPFPQFTAGRPDFNNEVIDPLGRRYSIAVQARF